MSTILKERKRLNKKIKKAKTIFLMGHKDLDLDALGSCIGMSIILNKKNKKWFIILDDQTH